MRVGLHFLPLTEELELPVLHHQHSFLQTVSRSAQRMRRALRDFARPLVPGNAAMLLLACHEKGEVLQPRDVPNAEIIERAKIFSSCIALKTCGSFFQHVSLPADDASEVDRVQ